MQQPDVCQNNDNVEVTLGFKFMKNIFNNNF